MNNRKSLLSPFQQLVSTPKGEKRLDFTETPAQWKQSGEETRICVHIETCGENGVRLLITNSVELLWTERIVCRNQDVACQQAWQASESFLNSDWFGQEYTVALPELPQSTQFAFPAYESEIPARL